MRKIFFALCLILSTLTYSQVITTFTSDAGSKYVDCNVTTLISMLKLTSLQWETKMIELGASGRELAENGISYTFFNKLASGDGLQFIVKHPSKLVMAWGVGQNGLTLFDDLIDEIEKNFLGTKDDQLMYGFKHSDNVDYIILIRRDKKFEGLTLYKRD